MKEYRRKGTIKAVQVTTANVQDLLAAGTVCAHGTADGHSMTFVIEAQGRRWGGYEGDWIVEADADTGARYIIAKAEFEASYREATIPPAGEIVWLPVGLPAEVWEAALTWLCDRSDDDDGDDASGADLWDAIHLAWQLAGYNPDGPEL